MKFLIASLVGAVIGYITNWLAIKMLFRPYEEKRIFGIKIPLTPGLIPKERYRIAKSVGETVGTHLVTAESIKEALSSEEMTDQLKHWVVSKIEQLKDSSSTVGEKLKIAVKDKYDNIIDNICSKVTNIILEKLKSHHCNNKILDAVEGYILDELNMPFEAFFEKEYVKKIKKILFQKIEGIKNSNEFKEKLQKYMENKMEELEASNKSLDEIIPESIIYSLKSYIYNNRQDICIEIGDMLKQPDAEEKIKNIISNIISSNLSPLVAMFVNTDMLYSKLISALDEYLREEENQRSTVLVINQVIQRIIKKNIGDILKNTSSEEKKNSIRALADFITNNVLTTNVLCEIGLQAEHKIREFKTINEFLLSFDENYMNDFKNYMKSKIDKVIEGYEFNQILESIVKEGVNQMVNTPIKDYIIQNHEIITLISINMSKEVFQNFVEKESEDMVSALNIPKIVEERINAFDVSFAEKLIIEIANRELSAITWLGAFLGAIIGVLSPILQTLY